MKHSYAARPFARAGLVAAITAAALVSTVTGVWAQMDTVEPEDLAPSQVGEQVRPVIHLIGRPEGMRGIGDGQIVWIMGDPQTWTASAIDDVKKWVAKGNVCWFDVRLAQSIGIECSDGASMPTAVVAQSAKEHDLVAGVSRVTAPDAFPYMRELPSGAKPILVVANKPEHVVLAVWELGKGAILFRPPGKIEKVLWPMIGKRGWIETDQADGAKLLSNLELFSLEMIRKAAAPEG